MTALPALRLGRLEISPGSLLVLAVLNYFDRDGVLLPVLLSALLHELGHMGAIHALGGRVTRLRLSLAGAELRLSAARPLGEGRLLLSALAGPAVNLLLAVTASALARRGLGPRLYFFAGLNLGLALFNLLPVAWLDGGRILKSLCALLGVKGRAETVTQCCSLLATLALLLAGALLLWETEGRGFTLLLAGGWMALAALRDYRQGL